MIYFVTKEQRLFNDLNNITICNDYSKVLEYFEDKKYIGLDTETEGFDPYTKKVLLMQLGDRENQFVIDTRTISPLLFKDLLEDPTKVFILQNAKFDLRFLLHYRIIVQEVFDTYLAEAVLFTGIKYARKALDFLVEKYLGKTLNKEIRSKIHKEGNTERVIKYAAEDVEFLEDLMNEQLKELNKKDLVKALDLDNKFVKVLAYCEYCGLYLNPTKWKAKMQKDLQRQEQAKQVLNKYIIDNNFEKYIESQLDLFSSERRCNINWDSPKQVVPLMKSLGVDTQVRDPKTGNMKDSVEADVIKTQVDKSPLLPLYLEYKKAEKVISTYGETWLKQINPISGRIHSSFTQILNTGRLSCGGKQGGVELVNLQNIPADAETRGCFTNQKEDNILVVCDYSGQESVVLTNMSKEPNLIEFYNKGLADLHSFVAAKINPELEGLDLDTIKTQYKEERQHAKAANFAVAYGGVGATIANNLGISYEEGDRVYNAYMDSFPELKGFFKKAHRQALRDGYILFNGISRRKSYIAKFDEFKALGERLDNSFWSVYRDQKRLDTDYFNNELKPIVREYYKTRGKIERNSQNYKVQGSSADITKLAGIYFYEYLIKNNLLFTVLISNFVHDEIVTEGPEDISKDVANNLQDCMERAGDVFCKIIKLTAEPMITLSWQH